LIKAVTSSQWREAVLFSTAFIFAAAGVVLLAFLAVFNEGVFGPGGGGFLVLMVMQGVVLAGIAMAVFYRGMRQLRARRGNVSAVPRLQMRFITLFAVAAVVPAVLMAAFQALVLNRGVEFWFAERVNTLVQTTSELGNAWPQVALRESLDAMRGVVRDLADPEAVQSLQDQRILYRSYLTRQARLRNMPALSVVDSLGVILARSEEAAGTPAYVIPSRVMFAFANQGQVGASDPERRDESFDYVRLLMRMPGYEDAYLYSLAYVDFSLLTAAEEATRSFRDAVAREQQMRVSFFFVSSMAAILVFLGAVWMALSAARQVVAPVGRLIAAAERVRQGELDVQVHVTQEGDEIAALSHAFNRMTQQLESQRGALLKANTESERRRAFIEAVLTGVSAGVLGIGPDGRITLANRFAATLLGRESEDLAGESLTEVAPEFAEVFELANRRSGKIAERQLDMMGEEGAIVNLSVRACLDDDGGGVITFDDVSRLVAAQRSTAWRDVARRIAHEIKNPLTPIQLSAERLHRRYRDRIEASGLEVFDKCVDTIVRQVNDIGCMVNEFSTFARMPKPRMEQIDLIEIADGCVHAQHVANPDIHVSLGVQVEAALVECDSRLVRQALANVLKNAAESVSARMERNGSENSGQIAVTITIDDGLGVIKTCDNGLGWPAHDRARLLEPYTTTRAEGSGLGLAIVHRIMEDHGGRLELDNRSDGGCGAVVRLIFPLLEVDLNASDSPMQTEA